MRLALLGLFLALLLSATSGAQVIDHVVPLSDGDPNTPDHPFGIALHPDGLRAYVTLCGNLVPWPPPPPAQYPAWNNDKVVLIDLESGIHEQIGTTGLYPEDAALALDASGAVRHVYVADGTDGTVTCLTPELVPVATIPLPTCFGASFASIYPFGMLASPDGTRVLVTTGGCGNLAVVDSDPASPTFNTVIGSTVIPGGHGRPRWLGYPLAVVPLTTYDPRPSPAWSQVGLAVVDVTSPGTWQAFTVTPVTPWAFPSTSDCRVLPNGNVLLPVGYDAFPRLLQVDPTSGTVVAQLLLNLPNGSGLHGLAISPDGRLAAVTNLIANEVTWVDLATFTQLATTTVPPWGSLPNAAVFTRDGSRLAVTLQGAAGVAVFRDLPGYDLLFVTDPTPPLGGALPLDLHNVEHGRPAIVFASVTGPGPQVVFGHKFLLSGPVIPIAFLTGDVLGDAATALPLPADPAFSGAMAWLQAATIDRTGAVRISSLAKIQLQ